MSTLGGGNGNDPATVALALSADGKGHITIDINAPVAWVELTDRAAEAFGAALIECILASRKGRRHRVELR